MICLCVYAFFPVAVHPRLTNQSVPWVALICRQAWVWCGTGNQISLWNKSFKKSRVWKSKHSKIRSRADEPKEHAAFVLCENNVHFQPTNRSCVKPAFRSLPLHSARYIVIYIFLFPSFCRPWCRYSGNQVISNFYWGTSLYFFKL